MYTQKWKMDMITETHNSKETYEIGFNMGKSAKGMYTVLMVTLALERLYLHRALPRDLVSMNLSTVLHLQ